MIEAAYDDSEGVTAEFNRNVLHVINRELDADFSPEAFEHIAFFDRKHEWIEMRLRSPAPVHRAGRRTSACGSTSPPARSCGPRSAPSSRARGVEADFEAAGLELDALVHGPGRAVRAVAGRAGDRVPASMQIEGSGALVAGGASGLGEATARRLHAGGAHVVIADLNEDARPALARRARRPRHVRARPTSPMRPRCRRPCAPPPRSRSRSGSPSRAPASAGPRASPASAARTRSSRSRPHPRQPDRHLQRAAARGRGDARDRADRVRRARRVRQHRLDRGLRRADRPDRLLGLEGRRSSA